MVDVKPIFLEYCLDKIIDDPSLEYYHIYENSGHINSLNAISPELIVVDFTVDAYLSYSFSVKQSDISIFKNWSEEFEIEFYEDNNKSFVSLGSWFGLRVKVQSDKDGIDIEKLIEDCANILSENGILILSYRDYSTELNDQQRFIPVKSDKDRILTCILDYEPEKVKVTDLLYEKTENGWNQKVSSYRKVRITPKEIAEMLENNGMKITFNESINRMQTTIAKKKNSLQ